MATRSAVMPASAARVACNSGHAPLTQDGGDWGGVVSQLGDFALAQFGVAAIMAWRWRGQVPAKLAECGSGGVEAQETGVEEAVGSWRAGHDLLLEDGRPAEEHFSLVGEVPEEGVLCHPGPVVVGLSRSVASAQRLEAAGVIVQPGDVDDPDGLAKAAADSDGVIHLAFQHEVAWGGNFAAAASADRRAVEAMGAALADSAGPLVLASGILGLAVGRVATEDDGLCPVPRFGPTPPGAGGLPPCSRCPWPARASARQCCASSRRSTATATMGSWPRSSTSAAGSKSGHPDQVSQFRRGFKHRLGARF
jgi:hypothetical protein